MGFSESIKRDILVKSARHCCVCHKPKGLNIEVHHIIPQNQGGPDTSENAIALCFDCHADAGHYFAGHPKGLKVSPDELRKHKEEWFRIVRENKIGEPKGTFVDLTICNEDYNGKFQPVFIREKTRFLNPDMFRRLYEYMGKDPMEFVNEMKEKYRDLFQDPYLNKVKSYEDYIDYLNGKHIKDDKNLDYNCQPVSHHLGPFREYKTINKSNCVLDLKLTNYGPEVLEDYKLYLEFENVIKISRVSKRVSFFDSTDYDYNVTFSDKNNGEFIPWRNVLVQNDFVNLDAICFRPDHKANSIVLKWKLFARKIQAEGTLSMPLKPRFEKQETEKYVPDWETMKTIVKILPKIEFA